MEDIFSHIRAGKMVVLASSDSADAEGDLVMAADLALYSVKGGNRGTYAFYHSSMNKELNDRRQIEIDLRDAIERQQLELFYQPIMSLRHNAIAGFEALARWRHPVKGMVPPALCIPVAEDSGLILPLGEWALEQACRQAMQWPDDLKVAVNLSPIQFTAPNLVDLVEQVLAQTGLAPHRHGVEADVLQPGPAGPEQVILTQWRIDHDERMAGAHRALRQVQHVAPHAGRCRFHDLEKAHWPLNRHASRLPSCARSRPRKSQPTMM